jgi:hypothetical protein
MSDLLKLGRHIHHSTGESNISVGIMREGTQKCKNSRLEKKFDADKFSLNWSNAYENNFRNIYRHISCGAMKKRIRSELQAAT